MLEKPDLEDIKIIQCLQDEYGLTIVQVVFLPLGADFNSAVYRVVADDETPYFLKLRSGTFNDISVTLPHFLSEQGIAQVIPPIPTKTQQLWTTLESFNLILYPFIEGKNGVEVGLSERQWVDFGAALKRIHTIVLPETLKNRIPRDTFSPQWRDIMKAAFGQQNPDPVAKKLAAFLKAKQDVILELVGRAEKLCIEVQARAPELVLCHSDIHGWNVLLAENVYLVDWDSPILAPKERDLMFVDGDIGGIWFNAKGDTYFYQGYGYSEIDRIALAYYRYERIIEDMAVTCQQIFLTDAGGANREEEFRHLTNQFLPNGVIEQAYKQEQMR